MANADAGLAELEARMAEPLDDDALADVMDAYTETLARLEEGGAGGDDAANPGMLAVRTGEQIWATPAGAAQRACAN